MSAPRTANKTLDRMTRSAVSRMFQIGRHWRAPRHRSALAMNSRAAHFGAEEVDLRDVPFTAELLSCIPRDLARRYRVLPVQDDSRSLKVAVGDPSDLDMIEALNRSVERELEVCVAEASQLEEFVNRLYSSESNA